MQPFIVLIAGGTASGKTTLVNTLRDGHPDCVVLSHDRYYRDVEDPLTHNYDHPDALDTARLVADLADLRAGHSATVPVYDFRIHRRKKAGEEIKPSALVIVEGILVLHDEHLRGLADLCVYVAADDDLRLARRLQRDIIERGRSPEGVLRQYLDTVRPGHQRFVSPSRFHADVVLDGAAPVPVLVAGLAAMIRVRGGPL
ncbi:MAG: uridine kinase [Oligoflexia bacterium]|nr:uridine kinase [Oligoflexia bacterium]